MTLGRQIAEARRRTGLNQTELGRRWKESLSTIGRFERDQGQPEFWQIVDLAELSGWPLHLFANAAKRIEDDDDDHGPGGQNGPSISDGRSFACTRSGLATVIELQRDAA